MATLTVYPDASSGSTTVDGYVTRNTGGSNETLSAIRSNAATSASTTSTTFFTFITAGGITDRFTALCRIFMHFDTSALGSGASISDATLSLRGTAKSASSLGSAETHITSSTVTSDNSLTTSDYSALGSTSFGSLTHASMSTSGYNDITLNASGISNVSLTGVSKFAGRYAWDLNNNLTGYSHTNNTQSSMTFNSADATGTTNDPKLTITYTVASSEIVYGTPMFFD